jgi:hypothetical protein
MPCEAARQQHGDGRHRGGGGGSAREAAAAGGGSGSLAAAWRAERRQHGSIGSFLSAGRCQMGGCASTEAREVKIAATEKLICKYDINLCLFMEPNFN